MVVETPVLTLVRRGLLTPYYCRGGTFWACASHIEQLFVSLPRKVILHGSTHPGAKAVKVHLPPESWGYQIDTAEAGTHKGRLEFPLRQIAFCFRKAGHKTIYLSMYECE